MKSPRFPPSAYNNLGHAEDGQSGYVEPGTRFVEAKPATSMVTKPFALQPPPIKIHSATPKTNQGAFDQQVPRPYSPPAERRVEAAPVAPGEQVYGAVPIPGAYQPTSPPPQQTGFNFGNLPGQAMTSEHRIESPPSSPRLPRAGLR